MATKTNKSFLKRLKRTRRGKLLARAPGKNHFNAKERRAKQLGEKRLRPFVISSKNLGRFLPYK